MKPAITGWDRKFAMKPSRSAPIASRRSPDSAARAMAAATASAGVARPRLPTAAAVISETTATGPTASVRLVPKTA